MIRSNCHTHSLYCDGKNTLREMVEAALEKNFTSLGFSGHCPMNFNNDWAMTKNNLDKYIDEVHSLKTEYNGKIDILCGVELDADYCDVDFSKLDFTIGSMHQFRDGEYDYPIDLSSEALEESVSKLFDGNWLEMSRKYYADFSGFICNHKPTVVGHFDLITKYNEKCNHFNENDADYQKYALDAVDKILDCCKDIIFEVNTGAMFRVGNSKPYPAPFIMKHLKKRGAKITITSDSHSTDSIDFAFDFAADYCRNFGFDKVYYLTSDGPIVCNI